MQHPPQEERSRKIQRGYIGQRIRTARLRLNLSQEALAERVGVGVRSIRRWEQGEIFPHPYSRERLCQILETNAHTLFELGGEEEGHTPPRPLVWGVFSPRNPFFTGRETLLQTLHVQLRREHSLALTQSAALHGLGGVGKTQLALEYVYRYASAYTAILWANAETHDTLLASFVSLAELLQLPGGQEQNQSKVIRTVIQWLEEQQEWLLVYDNVEDLTLLQTFLPAARRGSILLTTRLQAVGTIAQPVQVNPLDAEESLRLLYQRTKLLPPGNASTQLSSTELRAAHAIVEEMAGLPLALDQAGAYIEETQCSLEHYLRQYRQQRSRLLARRGHSSHDHPASVQTTLALSLDRVQQQSPVAAAVLRFCAFLAPDAIPEELLLTGFSQGNELFPGIRIDPWLLDEAIAILGTYSLVRRDTTTKTLSLHRLVQAVQQDRLSEQERTQCRERLLHLLNLVVPAGDVSGSFPMEDWSWCERIMPHVAWIASSMEPEDHSPKVATLISKLAFYLQDRARFWEAESNHRRALELWEHEPGAHQAPVIRSLTGLADAIWFQGKKAPAMNYAQQAITLLKQTTAADPFLLIPPLHILANIHCESGQLHEAEHLLRRALSIWLLTVQADGTPERATAFPWKQAAIEQASEVLPQHALALWAQAPHHRHVAIGRTVTALCNVYQRQQRYAEAEALLLPALHIGEEALGMTHHLLAIPLGILAKICAGQGRLEEARRYSQRALALLEADLGTAHPRTRDIRAALAPLLNKMG